MSAYFSTHVRISETEDESLHVVPAGAAGDKLYGCAVINGSRRWSAIIWSGDVAAERQEFRTKAAAWGWMIKRILHRSRVVKGGAK